MKFGPKEHFLPSAVAKAPNMGHEICPVGEQSKVLLETTQYMNEQIPLVRKLRRQRSAYLSSSEKIWIDNAIENVSTVVNGIVSLAEPVPETTATKQRRLPRPFLLHKLKYAVKNSPQESMQLGHLSIAAQSLNTAMSVLSASFNGSSSGRLATANSGVKGLDSSWNELSELVHRRRFQSSPPISSKIQLVSPQAANLTSRDDFQFGQQGSLAEDFTEDVATSYFKGFGTEGGNTYNSQDELDPGQSAFTHVHQSRRNGPNLLSEPGTSQCIDDGLTLMIETVEDWRQATERALDNINALSAVLTSNLMDPSLAPTFVRTRLQKAPQQQIPRRKPVPGPSLSISGPLSLPRPILEPSLRNSFEKEPLPQDSEQKPSTIQHLDKSRDVLTQFEVSPSTPSLCDVSNSSENASTTSLATIPSQPYRISRGRALLERRIRSFEEDEEENICLPER